VSAIRLTAGWVTDAVHGRLVSGRGDEEIGDVVTDTRTLKAGDFFIALRGERFDAHDFVDEAFRRGATGAIVERGFVGRGFTPRQAGREGPPYGQVLVEVADTTKALQDLAHAVRKAAGTRVVAITGSAGKTTTKETIAEFLSARFRVVKNKGNLNNHIGLPLSLMQLRERPDVAVMELGMNHSGEISTLVGIAEPDVRVWTNVGDAHLGFFASPDAIADAKAEILEGADANTLLVYNADDPRVASRAAAFAGRTLTFGVSSGATVRASDVEERGVEGIRARVTTPAGERTLQLPLLGRGNLSNVLASAAVALDFGISLDEIAERASRLSPADRRGAVRRLRDGLTLIDDSYNSSPTALRRALEVVAHDRAAVRKVAVLGEMLELGDHAIALHEECGRAAAGAGLHRLVTVGGAPARAMAAAAIAAGLPADAVSHFDSSALAAPAVVSALHGGDLVLVKGSRGTRTDLVADRIAAEFA